MTMEYDKRHGGAYDRGAADAYYRRANRPHLFTGATLQSEELTEDQMTPEQIAAYHAGYADQVASGEFKDWY